MRGASVKDAKGFLCYCLVAFGGNTLLDHDRSPEEECEMANINGESQGSFRWMLARATIGIAVIVSPCFAADLGASQGMQTLGTAPAEIMPFRCDSLDPKVCFDIYGRILNNRALPERPAAQRGIASPWLFYGTAGGGWEHDTISGHPGISGNLGGHSFSMPRSALPFSNEGWLSGWTAATGVEPNFAPIWSGNFEHRLGTPNWFGTVPPFK
jgi:hypothetical protein